MAIDNQHPIENTLETQIKEYIKRFGISAFLEYIAKIISTL